ncbi:M13-type metalloendopeptidase [Methanoregula sp.]|uniref:M13-type metalloendopeptidase n=1 Tax=Methanoregula sp. TaxID=2052170 RepID=UPI003C25A86E
MRIAARPNATPSTAPGCPPRKCSAEARPPGTGPRAWQGSYRDDTTRTLVYTDPHSILKYRVNGPLFNVPEFYDAFPEIQPGDAQYRNVSMRPVIW